MLKIGFVGEMASGKTQMTQYFLDKYGGQKISFADALKEDVLEYNLIIDGQIKKPRDRKLLQNYGQLRRAEIYQLESNGNTLQNIDGNFYLNGNVSGKCEKNHWLNMGLQKVENLSLKNINAVFDDIRFENEAKTLIENGFILFRIFTTKKIRIERLLVRDGGYNEENFNDISETETSFLPINYFIENNEHIEEAYKKFDIILSRINSN